MILSQGLPQLENTVSLMSVVHTAPAPAPAPAATTLSSHSSTNIDISSTINMLGQGIIATSNCLGSLEQLLANVANVSSLQNTDVTTDDNTTGTVDTDPSVIDSIALLIQSSGKRSNFCFGQG